MTLGLHDYERRRRRRFWGSTVKLLLILGVLLAIGLFAYQMGVEQVKGREAGLLEENAQLTQTNGELSRSVAGLRAAAQNAEAKAAELEARLARELPTGDLARLTELARERLAAGVEAKRLVFVLSQIKTPRACEKPENKRFILPTPVYKGPNSTVGFANGAITVSGEGIPARSATGNVEGWFDPGRPCDDPVYRGRRPPDGGEGNSAAAPHRRIGGRGASVHRDIGRTVLRGSDGRALPIPVTHR